VTNPPDPLTAITHALENCRTLIPAVQARHVLDARQGLYVPPPPGSDRDALPEELRALIAPHMPEYVSTTCQVALALDRASTIHLPSMVTLMDWERRQHAACRLTRKQDMARCVCDCHTGRPVAPAVETDLDDGFTGL
jgi:hypothetical protein